MPDRIIIFRPRYSATLAFCRTLARYQRTKLLRILIIIALLILFSVAVFGQAPLTRADSVERTAERLTGVDKADTLLWLTRHYRFKDTHKSERFARQAVELAKKLKDYRITPFYIELGIDFTILSDYRTARLYYDTALVLASHDEKTQAAIYANIAILLTYQEHFDEALKFHFKALDIYTRTQGDDGIMRAYSNIAWIYSSINNPQQAEKYYRLAHEYAVKRNDKPSIYTILGNIASNLEQRGKLREAKKINTDVIAYYESTTPGSVQVGNIYYNMAKIYTSEHRWDSSYAFAHKALALFKAREASKEEAYTYPVLANAELALGKMKEAEQHALLGRTQNMEFGAKTVLLSNLFTLVKIYRQQQRPEESLIYENEFWNLSDSIQRENQSQAVIEQQTKYETEKKNRENELLLKESELKDAKLAGSQYVILSGLLGLCLLGSFAFVLYQKNQHRYRLNKTLQTENEKLKVEMLAAQLNQLKDQINPHFLFNSLATLQSMAQEQDVNTATFVQKLSEVYRYILQTNSDNLVSVREELKVAEAYLFMLKARFEGALFITTQISDELLTKKIPPFSLQLLIENAIKHNAATHSNPLTITIRGNEHEISVTNTLQPKRSVVESTKVGLANLQKRFELLGSKTIEIIKSEKEFTVRLPLYS